MKSKAIIIEFQNLDNEFEKVEVFIERLNYKNLKLLSTVINERSIHISAILKFTFISKKHI